jgi:uncharacterized membrane protein
MDTLIAILHIGTAVFIVGPMAIIPMTGLRALRSGSAAQVRTLASSTAVFSWLSLITFVLGFGAMAFVPDEYGVTVTTPWILWSIILYALAFALSLFFVVPRLRAAATQLETSDGGSAAVVARPAGYGAIAGSSGAVSLLLVAVVVLMIWKP